MATETWEESTLNKLTTGVSKHACAVCNNHLYTFGGERGDFNSNRTNVIEKCSFVNGECQTLDVSLIDSVNYPRAVTIGHSV